MVVGKGLELDKDFACMYGDPVAYIGLHPTLCIFAQVVITFNMKLTKWIILNTLKRNFHQSTIYNTVYVKTPLDIPNSLLWC